jgi:asparagine synthetase B (glutamine-hydrolysing)
MIDRSPYIHVRMFENGAILSGVPKHFVGHRLPNGDGIFAEWIWEDGTLFASNDRYGVHPMFYAAGNGWIAISPSIPALLNRCGVSPAYDDTAMAVFCQIGFFLGEDTPFRAVKTLPPGAQLEWRLGSLNVRSAAPVIGRESMPRKAAIQNYAALFRAAIQRRLPSDERFTVPLTGGRDSRHILFALCEAGYRPREVVTARHFPPPVDEDVAVAALLAKRLEIDHVVVPRGNPLRSELHKNLATSFCADEHAWYMAATRYIASQYSTVYDGIGGDVLSAGLFCTAQLLDRFRRRDFATIAKGMRVRTEAELRVLLRPELRQRFNLQLATKRIIAELERHANAPNPVASFYFWNRTRREIGLSPYCLLREARIVYSPYLDSELFNFLMGLPADYVVDHGFHTETIHAAYPQYVDVPFEKKYNKVPSSNYVRHLAVLALAYTLRHFDSAMADSASAAVALARSVISGQLPWFDHQFLIYLLQIDGLARRRTPSDTAREQRALQRDERNGVGNRAVGADREELRRCAP